MKGLIVLFTLLLPALLGAQMTEFQVRQLANKASEGELVFESSRMLQENYYFHAEIIIDKLLTLNSTSPNYNYRKGFVVLDGRKEYELAIRHLQIAITDVDKNYDAYSHKENSAPIDAFFHLARCYHLDEQLDKAQEYFRLFIEKSSKKSERIKEAELMILQCEIAKTLMLTPKSSIVKNIGSTVNSNMPEFAPVISLDGTSLYFTSRRAWEDESSDEFKDPQSNQFTEDIYVSYRDFEGEWTSPERLNFCKTDKNEATIAVSSDEKKIYVYQDSTGNGDIYFSQFTDNKFDKLDFLDFNEVNTNYWETHCTMTPDGQTMYFVSDRNGGYGGRDIYRIVKLPNGEWSKAQNMGPSINTPYDEESPHIDINNKTLYYASNGPSSMGGFDIFVTFRDESNNWSTPLNMGCPINSTGDDLFYTTTVDGLRGYLTSFRKGGQGEKDIYEIQNDYLGVSPISSVRGSFVTTDDSDVPQGMKVLLKCPSCDKEEQKTTDLRVKNGRFFSLLERCKDYTLEYYDPEGTLIGSKPLTTQCNASNEEINIIKYIGGYILSVTTSDEKNMSLLEGVTVEFVDKETGDRIPFTTNAQGTFSNELLDGKDFGDKFSYEVHLSKEGYLSQTFIIDSIIGEVGLIQFDYLLKEIHVGDKIEDMIAIKPIYFDLNSSFIRQDAAIELDKIVEIMKENPQMVIELGSHTDCRGEKHYNNWLSDKRAKSSAKYIQDRISDPSRISGKGYGENQLINNCECEGNRVTECTEEEHQANRRTEFKIVKMK
ncbi:MAG: OmpA family protein [Crocinitomicaceae bacterium]|nr:OmpA family protein [Crocinitomicaceae bacterium]